jgi:peptidoglycan hydrolase FlgJ
MQLPAAALPSPAAASQPGAAMSPQEQRQREKTAEAARAFEAAILSTLMQSMFNGVSAGAFGGGEGEAQFKSLMIDAYAQQTAKAGGIGISDQVGREMLKLQGLS